MTSAAGCDHERDRARLSRPATDTRRLSGIARATGARAARLPRRESSAEAVASRIERDGRADRDPAALRASRKGRRVTYVKPHGALYHRAAVDRGLRAMAIVRGGERGRRLVTAMLGPPGSELLASAAAAGLTPVAEGFADRGYLAGRIARSRATNAATCGRKTRQRSGCADRRRRSGRHRGRQANRAPCARSACTATTPGAELGSPRRIADELEAAGIALARVRMTAVELRPVGDRGRAARSSRTARRRGSPG